MQQILPRKLNKSNVVDNNKRLLGKRYKIYNLTFAFGWPEWLQRVCRILATARYNNNNKKVMGRRKDRCQYFSYKICTLELILIDTVNSIYLWNAENNCLQQILVPYS